MGTVLSGWHCLGLTTKETKACRGSVIGWVVHTTIGSSLSLSEPSLRSPAPPQASLCS